MLISTYWLHVKPRVAVLWNHNRRARHLFMPASAAGGTRGGATFRRIDAAGGFDERAVLAVDVPQPARAADDARRRRIIGDGSHDPDRQSEALGAPRPRADQDRSGRPAQPPPHPDRERARRPDRRPARLAGGSCRDRAGPRRPQDPLPAHRSPRSRVTALDDRLFAAYCGGLKLRPSKLFSGNQYFALPGVRGNGIASRTFDSPVT